MKFSSLTTVTMVLHSVLHPSLVVSVLSWTPKIFPFPVEVFPADQIPKCSTFLSLFHCAILHLLKRQAPRKQVGYGNTANQSFAYYQGHIPNLLIKTTVVLGMGQSFFPAFLQYSLSEYEGCIGLKTMARCCFLDKGC